jgi:preprotein translocase subunit SecF
MPTFNRALFNSLNNTFVNDDMITEMIRYLKDEQFPEIIDTAQKQNLYQK